MRRKLFTIASAVSLLLFLATVALWVRSYSYQDVFQRVRYEPGQQRRRDQLILSGQGYLSWNIDDETVSPAFLLYNKGYEHLRASGDVTLPWVYTRLDLRGPHLGTDDSRGPFDHVGVFSNTRSEGWTAPSGVAVSVVRRSLTMELRFWLLAVIAMILPATFGVVLARKALRRRRRQARAQCPSCGYSTQGNASGVCPECGTPVAKAGT